MADKEKQVEVDTVQHFHCEEYGYVEPFKRLKVPSDVAARWISEGKAQPVAEAVEHKAEVIETPEDKMVHHEDASLRRKKQ